MYKGVERMRKRSIHNFKKAKNGIKISIILLILSIGVSIIFLGYHLLQIQVPERLRYIKDYKDFTLSVVPVSGCTDKVYPLFQLDNTIYNGMCIRQVYVNYGTTKAPLQMVLESNYIEWKDIQKKLSSIDEERDKTEHYEYRRSEEENGNYRVTVSPKEYQNTQMTEITFEIYEKEPEAAFMEGSLEIQ